MVRVCSAFASRCAADIQPGYSPKRRAYPFRGVIHLSATSTNRHTPPSRLIHLTKAWEASTASPPPPPLSPLLPTPASRPPDPSDHMAAALASSRCCCSRPSPPPPLSSRSGRRSVVRCALPREVSFVFLLIRRSPVLRVRFFFCGVGSRRCFDGWIPMWLGAASAGCCYIAASIG
jgi:hypothetical protein